MQRDGTEVKQLTDSKYRNRCAAWSPDGKWIAFGTSDKSGAGLFVIDAEGNNFKRLTYGNDEGAAWSPDGKTIVFTHFLQHINADSYAGGQLTRLVAIRFEDALQKPTSEDSELDNEDSRANLTEGKAYEADAAWSPDGKTIAFGSTRGENWRLYSWTQVGTMCAIYLRPTTRAAMFIPRGHLMESGSLIQNKWGRTIGRSS